MTEQKPERDPCGRFTAGNRGGPGNPHAKRVAEIRAALIAEVTDDDVQAIVRRLIEEAKAGDVAAAREVLDRVLGRAPAALSIDVAAGPADPEARAMADAIRDDPETAMLASDLMRRLALGGPEEER